ncbi:hypothetical protein RA307_01570 [Xanthobacteraceae bacterium Astr-EGSB]|uniref:hypothetical protein n=1 Tax=Astrobacterium formosum TaxID=3069710 RepID=UPI0027AEA74D|nr:hypothetical protein [Xanthobacteraceae bacterium Astr-EGSB]
MTLDEAEALRETLSAEFARAGAMNLVQQRIDARRINGFVRSLMERPMRELPRIFAASEPSLVGAARSGRALKSAAFPPLSRIIAHGVADDAKPNLSIGFSAPAKNDYRLEVRLQNPTVATVLYAQEVVRRAKGQARIAEYRELRCHSGSRAAATAAGLSIGHSIGHAKGQAGSIGLFVSSPGGVGVLSNSHILARCGRARRGDSIYAPHHTDFRSPPKVALLREFCSLIQDDAVPFDAAFATLIDGVVHSGNKIPTGLPGGGKRIVAARSKPEPGRLKVSKIGRTSGHTTGIFSAVGVSPTLEYAGLGEVKLTGMLEILWDRPDKAFSQPGDSGSVVFRPDTMEAIALVVGGGVRMVDGVSEGVSIACPLDQAMTEWNLRLL